MNHNSYPMNCIDWIIILITAAYLLTNCISAAICKDSSHQYICRIRAGNPLQINAVTNLLIGYCARRYRADRLHPIVIRWIKTEAHNIWQNNHALAPLPLSMMYKNDIICQQGDSGFQECLITIRDGQDVFPCFLAYRRGELIVMSISASKYALHFLLWTRLAHREALCPQDQPWVHYGVRIWNVNSGMPRIPLRYWLTLGLRIDARRVMLIKQSNDLNMDVWAVLSGQLALLSAKEADRAIINRFNKNPIGIEFSSYGW